MVLKPRWFLNPGLYGNALASTAYQKMSAAEKEIFKKNMAEIDEADAGVDEESPPPTPTPV